MHPSPGSTPSRTLLTLLGQFPLDFAGGAARSLDTINRMLVRQGWRAISLGTTATDHAEGIDLHATLAAYGVKPTVDAAGHRRRAVFRFTLAGVEYIILDTGKLRSSEWAEEHGAQFDALLNDVLAKERPAVVHTFGCSPEEMARQALCRAAGAAVVLGVRNHSYYDKRAFEHTDAVLTCSKFLSDCYRERVGIESTPLPLPMEPEHVVADRREPVFVTMINPTPDKGVVFFARLAEELASRRPDIPMLVVESRGTAGSLASAGMAGESGFDLRRHESIMISPGVPRPREIFAVTRVLVVPSLWPEPAGRVIVEAMMNGVPPIVSDRGGMGEVIGLDPSAPESAGGFLLPIPASITPETRVPPEASVVAPWVSLIERLCDDEAFYQQASARARARAAAFDPEAVAPTFAEFFAGVKHRRHDA